MIMEKIIETNVVQCLNYACMKAIIIKYDDGEIDNFDDNIQRFTQFEVECPYCGTKIGMTLMKRVIKMEYSMRGLFILPNDVKVKMGGKK